MTGTASTESEEFKKIYKLDVIAIPTFRQIQREDGHDFIFKTQRAKYAAIADTVFKLHSKGQPVLIGTTSIEKNEIIASMLRKANIPFQMLNAKNHRSEAEIIAKAGYKGAVTVATNMAGRGVDIILGGPKATTKNWQKLHDEVIELGGLHVIGTERHESRRIDNQLRGRAGRQGDPGSSQFYVALDDDLMRIFGGEKTSSLMSRFNMPEDEALTHPLVSKVIEQIQVKVEGYNFDTRKNIVEYDDVINKQRQIIYGLRDRTIADAHDHPEKIFTEISRNLETEINKICTINTNFETGAPEHAKIVQEFSEILPLPNTDRQRLAKDLEGQEQVAQYLFKLAIEQWQKRTEYFGKELTAGISSYAIVKTLDPLWVEHLTALDDLRDGVRLRGYAQKDPLVEYRKEGYEMFQKLMSQYQYNLCRTLFRLEPVSAPVVEKPQNITEGRRESLPASGGSLREAKQSPPLAEGSNETKQSLGPTINRNDPCWCGSGKKWKKCHYPKTST
jgi:preprotein translocase subunit SecA